jgi:hypothetical protein
MKTLSLSLAALSLAALAWQFAPSYGTPDTKSQYDYANVPVDFEALHAQARGALERLRERQATHEQRLSMIERDPGAVSLR